MQRFHVSPSWWQCLTVLAVFALAHAQPASSFTFLRAHVEGPDFVFESDVPLANGWELETASAITGPWQTWTTVGQGGRQFRTPVDGPQRHFRARNRSLVNTVFSVNLAGWVRVSFPSNGGHFLVANPMDLGASNRLDSIWPDAPIGTLCYRFDPVSQEFVSISQCAWGGWSPNVPWPAGEAFFVGVPSLPTTLTFAGVVEVPPRAPALQPGWNLLGIPLGRDLNSLFVGPGHPPAAGPQEGDVLLRFSHGSYDTYVFESGDWLPVTPAPGVGEGFWVFNARGIRPTGTNSAVYLNNLDLLTGLKAPLLGPDGRLLSGTQWLVQVYAGPEGAGQESLHPCGQAVTFRAGDAAGYVDTSNGGVVLVPPGFVSASQKIAVQLRFWEAARGSTYEQARSTGAGFGTTGIITCGFSYEATPPALPVSLDGLNSQVIPLPNAYLAFPRWDTSSAGFSFRLDLTQRSVDLQYSSDLTHWTTFRTVSNWSPGWVQDPASGAEPFRFYRAVPSSAAGSR